MEDHEFDSDFGLSGHMNRDVAVAEQRDDEERQADEVPGDAVVMQLAAELLTDAFAVLKQTVKGELSARGISCPVTVGWAMLDSDLSGETSDGSYSVVCYLTSNVTAGGGGHTVDEAARDIIAKVDSMLGEAAPFKLPTDSGPRAA